MLRNFATLIIGSLLLLVSATASGQDGLKDIAEAKKVYIGNIISNPHMDNPSSFRGGGADANLTSEYNAAVLENYMKMAFVLPRNEPANIHDLTVEQLQARMIKDRINKFLDRPEWSGLRKRGHAMIWYQSVPNWLNASAPNWTAEQVFNFSRKYILALGAICGDRMDEWDVINEAISDESPGGQRIWRQNTWYRKVDDGTQTSWGVASYENYIKMLFVWARQAQPNAKLYYNDYSIERFSSNPETKNGFMREKMKALKDCGAPIDGIGFQSHFRLSELVRSNSAINTGFIDAVRRCMEDLATAGFEVAITELDIRVCNESRPEFFQRSAYRAFVEMVLAQPNCYELLFWGLRDEDNWISLTDEPFFQGCSDAAIFEGDYVRKPAYTGVREALNNLDDADSHRIGALIPGNGSPADCAGQVATEAAILAVRGPNVVNPGDTVSVDVAYRATAEQDIILTFQLDSLPGTSYAQTVLAVDSGQAVLSVQLIIPDSTPLLIDAFQYQADLIPDGGDAASSLADLAQVNVDVVAEVVFIDTISSVTAPEQVRQGQNISLTVDYSSSTDRDVVVYFQLDEAPFTVFSEVRTSVNEGSGSLSLTLPVPDSTPVAEAAYQFQTLIVPTGGDWDDRLANFTRANVSVTSGTDAANDLERIAAGAVFPNPTSDRLTVPLLPSPEATHFTVYDASGRRITQGQAQSGERSLQLYLASYPRGLYSLVLTRAGRRGTVRIIRR